MVRVTLNAWEESRVEYILIRPFGDSRRLPLLPPKEEAPGDGAQEPRVLRRLPCAALSHALIAEAARRPDRLTGKREREREWGIGIWLDLAKVLAYHIREAGKDVFPM